MRLITSRDEVAHYIGRHGAKRAAKAVLTGGVPPPMLKAPTNHGCLSNEVIERIPPVVLADRSHFFKDLSAPFGTTWVRLWRRF